MVDLYLTRHTSKKCQRKLAEKLLNKNYDVIAQEFCLYRLENSDIDTDEINVINLSNEYDYEPNLKGAIRNLIFQTINSGLVHDNVTRKVSGENDLRTCYNYCSRMKVPLALIDRDIREIFHKVQELTASEFYLDFLPKVMTPELFYDDVKKYTKGTAVEDVLIKERDRYMSENIEKLDKKYDKVGCVVGNAHGSGISEYLTDVNVFDLSK